MRPSADDTGMTMIELLTVMVIMSIMTATAVFAFSSWQVSESHRSARDETVSLLRSTAERALSEGRAYCIYFNNDQYSTYRYACAGATSTLIAGPNTLNDSNEHLAVSFTAPSGQTGDCPGTPSQCAYFYPRGTASTGSVTVSRSGRAPFTISVEGLTSRVSWS